MKTSKCPVCGNRIKNTGVLCQDCLNMFDVTAPWIQALIQSERAERAALKRDERHGYADVADSHGCDTLPDDGLSQLDERAELVMVYDNDAPNTYQHDHETELYIQETEGKLDQDVDTMKFYVDRWPTEHKWILRGWQAQVEGDLTSDETADWIREQSRGTVDITADNYRQRLSRIKRKIQKEHGFL